MDINEAEEPGVFPELSEKVLGLMRRVRDALFTPDAALAKRLGGECNALAAETRKAEADCNAGVLVGIATEEERLGCVRRAQQYSRLGRIVHQLSVLVQNLQEIAKDVLPEELEAFRSIYLLAEVELSDAVLSVLRGDESLAHGVVRKDAELDEMYAKEMERIFRAASGAMFYEFRTGIGLLFILRAIERIGDHAKQLAVPSFYLLNNNETKQS